MNIAVTAPSRDSGQSPAIPLSFDKSQHDNQLEQARSASQSVETARTQIGIISDSKFFRTCLTRCLQVVATEYSVNSFDSIDAWSRYADLDSMKIVLLCANGQKATEAAVREGLDAVAQAAAGIRTIVISDVDHPSLMIAALDAGAKGYVPMTLDLEVAIGAIKLVEVGGSFIPASGLLSMRSTSQPKIDARGPKPGAGLFTERQLAVLEHLRKGDQNKIIAHKMSMSEATVKIHVRNMMRKLRAKNRTELVCMTNEIFGI